MLTRLRVSGFKNLVDTEIRFGPFTCIGGPNGVGKSNLFDAIRFLAFLANETLLNAALSVRSEGGRSGDIRSLFHRTGDKYDDTMAFEADMIIPAKGTDDLGQRAEATITFLRYKLEIGYKTDYSLSALGSLELLHEELDHINLGDAPRMLKFKHSVPWRKSAVHGRRTSPLISTVQDEGNRKVKLSQDGLQGRPREFIAAHLPRTVLSTVNATESPTALLARKEMQSWHLLQLEPNALREPDRFTTQPGLGADGSHLAATLFYLARAETDHEQDARAGHSRIYDSVSSRLSELIGDVYEVRVDRDQQREFLTLNVTEGDGTVYPARSLSGGTLRFLALTVLEMDSAATGLICLEEPENGIHPERIPAMLKLLQDIACDVENEVGPDNALRQVIVITHSPAVVTRVPDDSLLLAVVKEVVRNGERFKAVSFGWLPDTWRAHAEPAITPIAKERLLAYVSPAPQSEEVRPHPPATDKHGRSRRAAEHPDPQDVLPFIQD